MVGAPRTGTTLTMEVLNMHDQVHLYNEVHYHERVVDVLGNGRDLDRDSLERAIALLLKSTRWAAGGSDPVSARETLRNLVEQEGISHASVFGQFLAEEARAHGKTIWGDSSPQDVLYMDALKSWYPGARFIGLVRDPRAYLASYKNYYRKGVRLYRNRYNPWANATLWRSYMVALMQAKQSAFGHDVHLLKYEDLVSDPGTEIRTLCEFLELDFQESMLGVGRQNSSYFSVKEDFQQKGISASSVDRWRQELHPAEIWILESIAGVQLEALGYRREDLSFRLSFLPYLLKLGAELPGRLFNLLFRTGKPVTWQKIRKVLGAGR